MRTSWLAFSSTALLLACDAGELTAPAPPALDGLAPKIVRGRVTAERPEVGSLSVGCTGTLVAPEVVISAAHCFGFRSGRGGGRFTVEAPTGRQRYDIAEYKSYSRGNLGEDDIALVRLAARVPADVARPAPLATAQPAQGSALSVWGYGCTRRNTNGDWTKRRADFAQGERTNHLCPGDSGGPVLDEATGAVVRINSGYYHDGFGTDIFGMVPPNADRLRAQVEAWSSGGVPDVGEPAPQVDEPVCGLTHVTRQRWVCSDDGAARLRCKKGKAPERQACAQGCQTGQPGEDAACSDNTGVPCGAEYAPYEDWTCTADAGHVLRCRADQVQVSPCVAGCAPGEVLPAGCQ